MSRRTRRHSPAARHDEAGAARNAQPIFGFASGRMHGPPSLRMKMHRVLADGVAAMLGGVFDAGRVLDASLARAFRENPRWGRRDRAFIAESVFEIVRWRRALAFLADDGAIPALCAAQWTRMGLEVPDWWRHSGAPAADLPAREAALAAQPRAIRESIPDWLDALGSEELGDSWPAELHALNQRAPVFLRINPQRTSRDEAVEWLRGHQVEASPVPGLDHALVLPAGKSLPKPLLHDGRVEIQDAGSQHIAPLLDPQPGEHVIDACAGAGGKTLHLAAMMRDTGLIDALDIAPAKLRELKARARRAGVSCIRTHRISTTTPEEWRSRADRLLLDVPCSGLGTLRRQPDLKWRLSPMRLERVRAIQRDLLARYPAMLRRGGRLVYATCSILPSENQNAVRALADDPAWRLLSETVISPADTGFDGFFAAVIERA